MIGKPRKIISSRGMKNILKKESKKRKEKEAKDEQRKARERKEKVGSIVSTRVFCR